MILVLRSAVGLLLLAGIAWLLSENRRRVQWQTVAVGLGLQVVLGAMLILVVCGMSTIAGTMMVVYANFMTPVLGAAALGHILAASLISAPAAIVVAHIMVPETDAKAAEAADRVDIRSEAQGCLDAIVRDTTDGVQILINVVAMLLVAIAFIFMMDAAFGLLPEVHGEPLRFQRILGWGMAPLVWLIGVPWTQIDCRRHPGHADDRGGRRHADPSVTGASSST